MLYINKEMSDNLANSNDNPRKGFMLLYYDTESKTLFIRDDNGDIQPIGGSVVNSGDTSSLLPLFTNRPPGPTGSLKPTMFKLNLSIKNTTVNTSDDNITIILPEITSENISDIQHSEYNILNVGLTNSDSIRNIVTVKVENDGSFVDTSKVVNISEHSSESFILFKNKEEYIWTIKSSGGSNGYGSGSDSSDSSDSWDDIDW